MRTRRAHIRVTDADGHEWRLTWCPGSSMLVGRPKHARTTYTVFGVELTAWLRAKGEQASAKPKDDPRQLRFA